MAEVTGRLIADLHPKGTVRIIFIASVVSGNEFPITEKNLAASRAHKMGKNEPWEPRSLPRVSSGDKFVVSRAGEAYDARVRGPNRKYQ